MRLCKKTFLKFYIKFREMRESLLPESIKWSNKTHLIISLSCSLKWSKGIQVIASLSKSPLIRYFVSCCTNSSSFLSWLINCVFSTKMIFNLACPCRRFHCQWINLITIVQLRFTTANICMLQSMILYPYMN
jgi:hypothetical protein